MHETFFGLQKRPFLAVPTLDRYCPVECQEAAFENCTRAIARAEGPVAILGGTGLGKTMLCLRIGEAFRGNFEVVMLASSQICSRRALLQSLLFELRMPYRDLSEGELRLSLLDRLQPSNENPTDGLVLIVDEAQTLSVKLLDELRLITNLARDGVPRVRLVLCGTLRLDELLGSPQLESLNQRLACRCYLTPLNQSQTLYYLTYKVERCGASIHSVFTDDAMRLIHRATDGVPRLIDQVADQALRVAAESRQRPISASLVETAWASLQQIPLPWSDPGSPIAQPATSIEYGSLDEDGDHDFASSEPLDKDASYQEPSKSTNYFDRPIVSPVPSAGMGLSSVAPLATSFGSRSLETEELASQPSESAFANEPDRTHRSHVSHNSFEPMEECESVAEATDRFDVTVEPSAVQRSIWDDFLSPSDRRFETGVIEDFVDDLLDEPQPESLGPTEPLSREPSFNSDRHSIRNHRSIRNLRSVLNHF